MQITVNVATVFVRGAERPLTAGLVKQLQSLRFGGRNDQYAVVCTCVPDSQGAVVLVQGPDGLAKISQSNFVNCGAERQLGVTLTNVPRVILG